MHTAEPKLLIIYNAESGILNAIEHAVHKQLKPSTYPCSLCALTYGLVSMRGQWRKFLDSLPFELVFHHSDDFAEAYPDVTVALPAMMTSDVGEQPKMLIGAEQLNAMADLDELVAATKLALTKIPHREAA